MTARLVQQINQMIQKNDEKHNTRIVNKKLPLGRARTGISVSDCFSD